MMSYATSILLYFFVFAVSAIIVQYGYKYKTYTVQIIGMLLPITLGGFRYNVGLDYFSYLNAYADIINPQAIGYRYMATPDIDCSFYIISHISNLFFSSPVAMYFIYCAITVFAFYRALSLMKPRNIGIPLFFFYSIFFLNSFNIVRQGAAISLGCLAITHYISGNKFRAIIYLLIATAFHASALLLVAYAIVECVLKNRYIVKKKKESFVGIFLATCIVSTGTAVAGLVFPSINDLIYSATGRIGESNSMFSMGVVFKYILCLACLYLVTLTWQNFNNIQKRLSLFLVIGTITYSLGLVHNESARLGMYLIALTPILFAITSDNLRWHRAKIKLLANGGLILLSMAYIVAVHVESGNGVQYNYMDVITSKEYQLQIKDLGI